MSTVTRGVLILAVLLVAVRFINREADFPEGINWSGDIYTDEGWYNRAAVEHYLTGRWVVPGDLNTIVNHPVSPILQRAAFAVFGMSLSTARLTVCLAFAIIALAAFGIVRRLDGARAGALVVLLLAVNFFAFAYSRVGTLDLLATMFVMLALWLALMPKPRADALRNVAVGIVLTLAVLTKGIAVHAIPVIAVAAWIPGAPCRENLRRSLTVALIPVALTSLYTFVAFHAYEADYRYYFSTITPNARNPVATFSSGATGILYLGRGFVAGCILLTLAAAWLSAAYRTSRLVILAITWIAAFLLMLSLRDYTPPRYYLPLVVPFSLLGGVALHRLTAMRTARIVTAAAWTLMACIVLVEGRKLVEYEAFPRFTFVNMARQLAASIRSAEARPRLLGAVADSVALETAIPPVNSVHGPRSLDWKLDRYEPTHWIAVTDATARATVEQRYDLTEIGAWDVFDNYYTHDKARLFRLTPKAVSPPAQTAAK